MPHGHRRPSNHFEFFLIFSFIFPLFIIFSDAVKTELLEVVDVLQRVNWTMQKDIDARDISHSVADVTPVIHAAAACRAAIEAKKKLKI